MTYRRSATTRFLRADASEPEEAGITRESGTANVETLGDPPAGKHAEAAKVPPTYRRSTSSVFSSLSGRSRLSSRVFTSPPKKLLGHLAVCGDRLRSRTGARTRDEECNVDDSVTVFESKVLPVTVSGPPSTGTRGPPSADSSRSETQDRLLPSENQRAHSAPCPQQQCSLYQLQRRAAKYEEPQQQHNAPDGGTGKEEVQSRALDEEQKQSKRISDQLCVDAEGVHQAGRDSSAFPRNMYYLHTAATPCDPVQAYLTEPKRISGHRSSTSTNASRRSSNGSESVSANPPSPAEDHEAGGGAYGFSTPVSLGIGCAIARDGNPPNHMWKPDNISDGRNSAKGIQNGVEGSTGEVSTGVISKTGRGAGEDKLGTADGQGLAGTAYLYDCARDPSQPLGKNRDLPRGDTTEMSIPLLDQKKLSSQLAKDGRKIPPPLTSVPLDVSTSVPGDPCGPAFASVSGTRLEGSSAVLSAALPAAHSCALSKAAAPASSTPAPSPVTSPVSAVASCRLKKTVGMRLSGMLHQGRAVLKFGSAEKEALPRRAAPARSRTEPTLSLKGSDSAPAVPVKNTIPQDSANGVPSSESSRLPLSLFPRSSPLLLRQLRRRTPGTQRCAGLLGQTNTHTGDAINTGIYRREQGSQLDLNSTAVSAAGAGEMINEKNAECTHETTRRAGVLRRGREEAHRRGGGNKTEKGSTSSTRGRETAMYIGAKGGRSGRRLTSSGVPGSSRGGDRQAKCVRFGSMSIHVYTQEARIRSCSSDSVNFAVTLDPPVSTDGYSDSAYDTSETAFRHAADDFSDADSYSAEDEGSYDENGEEEDDEEIRANEGYEYGSYQWKRGRLSHTGRSKGRNSFFAEHATTAAAAGENEGGPAVGKDFSYPRWGVTREGDPCELEREERRVAGLRPKEGAAHTPGAPEGEREDHTRIADESEGATVPALERYPPVFEGLFGRPQTPHLAHESCGKRRNLRDMGSATDVEERIARVMSGPRAFPPVTTSEIISEDADDASLHQHHPEGRQVQEIEKRIVNAIAPQSSNTQNVESGHRVPMRKSCSVKEKITPITACSLPMTSGHVLETLAAADSTSTHSKVEPITAEWWKRHLSNSSGEPSELCEDTQHHRFSPQRNQAGESAEDKQLDAETGQAAAQTSAVASSLTASGSLTVNVDTANKLARTESVMPFHNSYSGAPQQRQKLAGEGTGEDVHCPHAFQEEGGLPEVLTQNRRKSSDPMRKGIECTEGQKHYTVNPRRVHSDEYAGSAPSYTQWQRLLSDTLTQREYKRASEQSQHESHYLPVFKGNTDTKNQHVGGMDETSPFFCKHGTQQPLEEEHYQAKTCGDHRYLNREQKSFDKSLPFEDPVLKTRGSSTGSSLCSTIASRGVYSEYSAASTLQDLPLGYVSSETFSQQEPHSRTGSVSTILCGDCNSVSSHAGLHSKAVTQFSTSSERTAKQHGAPERHQPHFCLRRESAKSDVSMSKGEIGSRGSVSSAGRSLPDEEMLSKATEEVLARSGSHMSAEEKENLRDILKGWCS